jgi:hypothetical protein
MLLRCESLERLSWVNRVVSINGKRLLHSETGRRLRAPSFRRDVP